ncbi:hypothetical protein FB451DRAFT_698601 [Mycena latifolia]|nr:hypothetical protein FB451DRAFT_698601 [Mycena latifolia]
MPWRPSHRLDRLGAPICRRSIIGVSRTSIHLQSTSIRLQVPPTRALRRIFASHPPFRLCRPDAFRCRVHHEWCTYLAYHRLCSSLTALPSPYPGETRALPSFTLAHSSATGSPPLSNRLYPPLSLYFPHSIRSPSPSFTPLSPGSIAFLAFFVPRFLHILPAAYTSTTNSLHFSPSLVKRPWALNCSVWAAGALGPGLTVEPQSVYTVLLHTYMYSS